MGTSCKSEDMITCRNATQSTEPTRPGTNHPHQESMVSTIFIAGILTTFINEKFLVFAAVLYRGYYTVARTFEVYLWVEKIFHEWAQRTSKSFFHEKIHFVCSSQRVIFFLLHRWVFRKYIYIYIKKTRQKTKEWRQRYLH